ncbi:MAG TPA: hypothetical protein VGL94_23665 [Ktedonobacteraceae bacterium]|jgi:hypothetical protein
MSVKAHNTVKQLNFAGPHIDAKCIEQARDYPIQGRAIVVNPHTSNAYIGETPKKSIPPLSSTILKDTRIEQAASLILLQVKEEANIGNIILEPGWDLYGNLVKKMPGKDKSLPYPQNTPLWRSPQDDAGIITFDPSVILDQATAPQGQKTFQVKVNLWFAPSKTNCFIHNQHDFIEIHSQVYGSGRMQKFRAQDNNTLYEDLLMSQGYTTPVPFCSVGPNTTFIYPWHQYYADTDCIWLAIEYHPCKQ